MNPLRFTTAIALLVFSISIFQAQRPYRINDFNRGAYLGVNGLEEAGLTATGQSAMRLEFRLINTWYIG